MPYWVRGLRFAML
jgi:hypothetical protein